MPSNKEYLDYVLDLLREIKEIVLNLVKDLKE